MDNSMAQFDTLEQDFRTLEREAQQRDCQHNHRIEITTMGDRHRRWLCGDCGHEQEEHDGEA